MDVTLAHILDEGILESAYAWLCKRRRNYPDDADVWNFRRHWEREMARLRRELLEGSYRLGLLIRTTLEGGDEVDLFVARAALVLKALALVLGKRLSFSRNCTHLEGNGGGKGAVPRVWRHLKQHGFVIRTDVRSYYASIDHQRLMERLSRIIWDRRMLRWVLASPAQALRLGSESSQRYHAKEQQQPDQQCEASPVERRDGINWSDVIVIVTRHPHGSCGRSWCDSWGRSRCCRCGRCRCRSCAWIW